jgi:hypothetical protein
MTPFTEPFVREFKSPSELFEFIPSKLITRNHRYGFRGHRSAAWALEPTVSRFVDRVLAVFPERGADREGTTKRVLRRLREEFVKNLIINNDLPQDRIEKIDIWQYGQHFGLPSPLLDWTYSPYVALFFALWEPANESQNTPRCVWAVNLEMIELLNQMIIDEVRPHCKGKIEPEEFLNQQIPTLDIVQDINENNRRQAFQQAFFTKHEHYRSLEVWLKRITSELTRNKADRPVLHKYVFACTERERIEALDWLDRMNINSRTLFPDTFGSVMEAIDATLRSFQDPAHKHYSFKA